jgi:hypothetical protein
MWLSPRAPRSGCDEWIANATRMRKRRARACPEVRSSATSQIVSARSPRHTNVNTIIMPWIDVVADVAAIRKGRATRDGNAFSVHGRVHVLESTGRLFPRHGNGFHQLSRGAYRALSLDNDDELHMDPEQMLDLEGITAVDREIARGLKR